MSSSSTSETQMYLIFGFFLGIVGFFWGFVRLRQKRMIENIPTSTVRGAAIGLVELIGKAHIEKPLVSPITQTPCVYYKYKVEEYRRSGKSSRWVTIAKGDSGNCPFWIEDQTGKILVFPKGATIYLDTDYTFQNRGSTFPDNIQTFERNYGISLKGLIFNRSLRFREWHIENGLETYVIGTCQDNRSSTRTDSQQLLTKRLNEVKGNAAQMAKIDTNKDGEVSTEEWDAAVNKIEQQVLEDQLKDAKAQDELDVIITQGDVEKFYMISDHSQKTLTGKLSFEAFLGVFGGAALTVFCLWMLIFLYPIF